MPRAAHLAPEADRQPTGDQRDENDGNHGVRHSGLAQQGGRERKRRDDTGKESGSTF
jgi:hypothetical protein